jgi:hypothetical protein
MPGGDKCDGEVRKPMQILPSGIAPFPFNMSDLDEIFLPIALHEVILAQRGKTKPLCTASIGGVD